MTRYADAVSDDPRASGARQGTVETEPGWRARTARQVGDAPEWAAWSWAGGARRFSWLGVFLVLVGAWLLIQAVQPRISLTSLLLVALGLAFAAAWFMGGVRGAFVPASVLIALGAARLGSELGWLVGDGYTALALGGALVLAWLVGRAQGVRRDWALWIGVILLAIGFAQASDRIPGIPDLGLVGPAVIIVLGGVLLLRARLRSETRSADRREAHPSGAQGGGADR